MFQVSFISSSIPVVSNVTTIHDLSIQVLQISIWNLLVLGKIVVKNITANREITIVEVVLSGPSLSTELDSSDDKGVEHAKSEQESLEVIWFVTLCLFEMTLIELAESSSQVRLEI